MIVCSDCGEDEMESRKKFYYWHRKWYCEICLELRKESL